MTSDPTAEALPSWVDATHIHDVSARGVASHVAALIRSGDIALGELLPPVRVLSRELRVSPSTISTAWGLLKKRGLLAGTGKSGVRVASATGLIRGLELYATVPGVNDLRLLYPDGDLLPALDQALVGAAHQQNLNEYYDSAILPALQEAIEPSWPVRSEAYAVANGGADAVWSVLQSNSVPGDRILVESPTQPQLLSLMVELGLTIVPVPYVSGGLDPRAFRDGLGTRPAAIFLQPRAQVPTGLSASRERVAELAALIRGPHRPLIMEYDDLGALARTPHHSFAAHLPDHTAVIRSYEKSYGPDLRLAVIGAPAAVIRNAHAQIRLTRQWTSRILQAALAWMLRDPETAARVAAARAEYAHRLDTLASLLRARDVPVAAQDGFCVWVPVVSESAAVEELSALGILVMRGSPSYAASGAPHIRIATSRLAAESMPRLADFIAAAAARMEES